MLCSVIHPGRADREVKTCEELYSKRQARDAPDIGIG